MIAFKIQGRIKFKALVEQYVASILRELQIHRLKRPCIIINFRTTLSDDRLGLCVGDEDFALIEIARVSGNERIPYLDMMQNLAHELVHAKQFIKGELGYNSFGDWRWKNRNAGGYRYKNQPWEKQANKLESLLFQKCFPTNQLRGRAR